MNVPGLFSSCCRASRLLQLTRHFHSTLPVASSTLSERELTNLQDALKRHKSTVQLHQPSSATPSKTRSMVLLVGWVESTLKVLAKYASVYTDTFGIPCLAIAPPIQLVWFTKQGYSFTDNILKALNHSLDDTPVSLVLHLCSSGGHVVFPRLLQETNSLLNSKLHQQCMIFDSGPTDFSFNSGVAAANQLYRQGGLNLLTYPLYTGIGVTVNTLIGNRKRQELKDALESQLLDVPQLYLYSRGDTVAPPQWVEEVMRGQREKGIDISYHCWEDSEHVQHFREHTQEYIEQVRRFLNKCKITS